MTGGLCQVEFNGSAMPADLEPLLTSAHVETSQRLPDMFALRFRDPERIVLSKSGAKVGGRLYSDALSAESGPAGTYIRMMKHNISEIEKALTAGPA